MGVDASNASMAAVSTRHDDDVGSAPGNGAVGIGTACAIGSGAADIISSATSIGSQAGTPAPGIPIAVRAAAGSLVVPESHR